MDNGQLTIARCVVSSSGSRERVQACIVINANTRSRQPLRRR
jgi:hypothetical protein